MSRKIMHGRTLNKLFGSQRYVLEFELVSGEAFKTLARYNNSDKNFIVKTVNQIWGLAIVFVTMSLYVLSRHHRFCSDLSCYETRNGLFRCLSSVSTCHSHPCTISECFVVYRRALIFQYRREELSSQYKTSREERHQSVDGLISIELLGSDDRFSKTIVFVSSIRR